MVSMVLNRLINPSLLNSKTLPLPPPSKTDLHARTVYSRLYYSLIVLFVGLVLLVFGPGMLLFAFVSFVLATLVATYVGWQALSEYQIFKNTPVSTIDSAIQGLCEVQAKFVSERDPLPTNPVTGETCLYYKLELHYESGDRNSRDIVEWSYEIGAPCILNDGSGYMYGNYGDAEFGFYETVYLINDKRWFDFNARNEIFTLLNESQKNGKLDFSKFSDSINIDNSINNKPDIRYSSMEFHATRSGYYLLLRSLPDIPYFVISSLTDTGKRYNGKPLKLAAADPKNRLFSVLPESKDNAVSKLKSYYMINFVVAVISLVLAVSNLNSLIGFLIGP